MDIWSYHGEQRLGISYSIAPEVQYLPGNHSVERVPTDACFYNSVLGCVDLKVDIKRENLLFKMMYR